MKMGSLLCLGVAIFFYADAAWGEDGREKWPPREQLETMTHDEEVRFVDEWKNSFSKGIIKGPSNVIGRLRVFPFPDDPLFFRMKYKNPALITCVVETYIAAYQRDLEQWIAAGEDELTWPDITDERIEFVQTKINQHQLCLQRSIARDGNLAGRLGEENYDVSFLGETGLADYWNFLEVMAASTYSPRVFEYLGSCMSGDEARLAYHARVEPERMLTSIFSATAGVRLGQKGHFGTLYRNDRGASLNVEFVFACITQIVAQNPRLGVQYHDETIDLIRQYGKIYYRADDPVFSRSHSLLDYRQRLRALELLNRVAIKEDIPTVRWLAEDTEFQDGEKNVSLEEKVQARKESRAVILPPTISTIAHQIIQDLESRG